MQLDNTRIVIRERDFPDILDLGLRMTRVYGMPWLITSLVGAVPLAILNWWLLGQWQPMTRFHYVYCMAILVVWEMPLASAATTRWLGHALFEAQPSARLIARDLAGSVPQLLFYQVFIRGLLILPPLLSVWAWPLLGLWLVPFVSWPYLDQLVLLERNPFRARAGRMTTARRSRVLHTGARGSLFGRFLTSILFAAAMVGSSWLSIWYVQGLLTHRWKFDGMMFTVCLPLALWVVASFFAVVRYLSYLDLRIRREGWEVELRVRAEAGRLTRQTA